MVSATAFAFSIEEILPTLPPLNPNQPIHNKNAPSVTSGIFEAGITLIPPVLVYLPFLAPIIIIAASKAHPPVEWITVEPAKSYILRSRIVPSIISVPQDIFTTIG